MESSLNLEEFIMARIKTKTIKQTVARDLKTGRFVPLSTKPSRNVALQAVRIPTRTLFGYGQTA
jgi:hypothetical protein